ncbi:ATP synthase subunit I [Paenibacillus ginsengarvi]|uniref:ATP synthase subunit I n=1 Tax=Paenibacillus ginsengarvi TaxID=400777 RepID=A0A3B0C3B5_9BACL|nr:ATP synthase subunit I [Paenibacillus ginsengarvi]RKN78829.1 ATP synthase subunit I [Paenibacillus ginsengarvi]
MNDLSARLKTATRASYLMLCICFLGWAIFPQYKGVFAGLVIGIAASVINSLHLSWKIYRLTDLALGKTSRKTTLGFLTRACIVLLAVIVSTRTFQFNLIATLAGLFFVQLATLVLGIISTVRDKQSEPTVERGEKENGSSETADSP